MTGKERLLAALRGEQPDFVPFAPNLHHWFYYNQYHGTLPPELAYATHPNDVLRHLNAEIFTRWDSSWATKSVYSAGEYSEEYTGNANTDTPLVTVFNIYPPGATERRRKFVTPYGMLTQVWQYSATNGTDFDMSTGGTIGTSTRPSGLWLKPATMCLMLTNSAAGTGPPAITAL